jgi:hypothetical protein
MSRSYRSQKTSHHNKATKVYKRFRQVSFKIRATEWNELSGAL